MVGCRSRAKPISIQIRNYLDTKRFRCVLEFFPLLPCVQAPNRLFFPICVQVYITFVSSIFVTNQSLLDIYTSAKEALWIHHLLFSSLFSSPKRLKKTRGVSVKECGIRTSFVLFFLLFLISLGPCRRFINYVSTWLYTLPQGREEHTLKI